MDARTQRTLYRLLAIFLAVGGGDALVQFFSAGTYDWRHLTGALGAAAVLAIEKYLSESNSDIASPTVAAVNVALANNASAVPPPKVAIPEVAVLTAPAKPPGAV